MANADKNKVADFNGPSYGNDAKTGISKFYLVTPTGNGNSIEILTGLLNEMPEFSISVDYENGPGADWQDMLMGFMTSDTMRMATMIGSANGSFKNLLKMGSWTKKIYAGYKPSSINLNFRIYASDTLGQSSINSWIRALNSYATLNAANEFSINSAFQNIGNAMKNMQMTGQQFGNVMQTSLKNFLSTNNTDSRSEEEKFNDRDATVVRQISMFNRNLPSAVQSYKWKNSNKKIDIACEISVGTDHDDAKTIFGSLSDKPTVKLEATYSVAITYKNSSGYVGGSPYAKKGVVKDVGSWKNLSATPDSLKEAKANSIEDLQVEKIFEEIKQAYSNNEAISAALDGILEEYRRITDTFDDNDPLGSDIAKAIYKTLSNMEQLADKTGKLAVAKYDDKRVFRRFNKENGLGEKLWFLVLYPDVFFSRENPLIVYIKDWEAKYSEEFSTSGPIYCDFKITCCLDQTYSRAQWYRVLAPGVRDLNTIGTSPFQRNVADY